MATASSKPNQNIDRPTEQRKAELKDALEQQTLPAFLFLNDVQMDQEKAPEQGGFSQIFCGTYHHQKVALKRLMRKAGSTSSHIEKVRPFDTTVDAAPKKTVYLHRRSFAK